MHDPTVAYWVGWAVGVVNGVLFFTGVRLMLNGRRMMKKSRELK